MRQITSMQEDQYEIPILYLMFNRPDLVRQTFPAIKEMKPKFLFLSADGPREGIPGEEEKCSECREWVEKQIDWNCEVMRLYRKSNLGCKMAVSGGITWLFNHVEMGVIVEDDILTSSSFFQFCELMLKKYKSEDRIKHISGLSWLSSDSSYTLSYNPGIWGWATWKDRWAQLDLKLDQLENFLKSDKIKQISDSEIEKRYHIRSFLLAKSGFDTWDYSWKFTLFNNLGLCIWPGVNLTSNIGLGNNATHTTSGDSWKFNRPMEKFDFDAMSHPIKIERDQLYDRHLMNLLLSEKPEARSNFFKLWLKAARKIIHIVKGNEGSSRAYDQYRIGLRNNANHIFVTSFPKSGSTYLGKLLSIMSGYRNVPFIHSFDQNEQDFDSQKFLDHRSENTVTQQHMRATDSNVGYLREYEISPVVLTRNMFDCIVSLRDHMINEPMNTWWPMANVTTDFYQFDDSKQIDFIVDLFVPWYVNFFVGWQNYSKDNGVLWLTYDELISDPEGTVKNIVKYSCGSLIYRPVEVEMTSGRKNIGISGRGDSLSVAQKNRVYRILEYYPNNDFSTIV